MMFLRCEMNKERYGETHRESRNTGRDLYGLNEYEIGLKNVLDQYDDSVTEVEQEEDLTPYDDCMLTVQPSSRCTTQEYAHGYV